MSRSALGGSAAVLSRRGSTAEAPSIITRGSDALDSFTRRSRPRVAINLDGQKDGFVNSYTTLDAIKGTVTVTVDHDTRFDDIEIAFEGTVSPNCHAQRVSSQYLSDANARVRYIENIC